MDRCESFRTIITWYHMRQEYKLKLHTEEWILRPRKFEPGHNAKAALRNAMEKGDATQHIRFLDLQKAFDNVNFNFNFIFFDHNF